MSKKTAPRTAMKSVPKTKKPIKNAVWCIKVGTTTFRAIHCQKGDTPGTINADKFAVIEYPQPLSNSKTDSQTLVSDALQQFLANEKICSTDSVALCLPGQSGMTRFATLPPVATVKIKKIIEFEVRQQIPYPLDQICWDYLLLPGANEAFGFAPSPDVLISAVKRDTANDATAPFTSMNILIDLIQLSPLAFANFWTFDYLHRELKTTDAYEEQSPPPFTALLSMGTQTSDLVITNGYRLWMRNLPLGGWHFTKALAKELKLTFGKAEYLKRNIAVCEDQAMILDELEPVVDDLLQEITRSIKYFQSLNKKVTIERLLCFGNALKIPKLPERLNETKLPAVMWAGFDRIVGNITTEPRFQENVGGFASCYGLAVQALGWGNINTNLLPKK